MEQTIDDDQNQSLVVRRLRPDDMNAVVRLDAKVTGRKRERYYDTKLKVALADTGIEVSLAAESDGLFLGFLLARVYYGEFGVTERTAVLDTLVVHPDFQGQGVGRLLLRQLRTNLHALQISSLQTQVNWVDQKLLSFFQHEGFSVAQRLSLDLDVSAPPPDPDIF